MDKLEQIGHLVVAALSKAQKLRTFVLDPESRAKAAELMKRASESHEKMKALSGATQTNGKGLNKARLDSALDDLIKTFEDINKKLDDLLAEAQS